MDQMKALYLIMLINGLFIFDFRIDAQTSTASLSESFFTFTKGEYVNAESVTNSSISRMLKRYGYLSYDDVHFPPLPPERDVLQIEEPTFKFLGDRYYSDPDDYYKGTGEITPEERFDPAL
jgi:hypothetical protein